MQSRSYWAPANIGPYSQAISIPLSSLDDEDSPVWAVSVAGQIPLIPHTMSLPINENGSETLNPVGYDVSDFNLQTVLALQHLWRIGLEMSVQWWTSAVAYLPRSSLKVVPQKAAIVSRAWKLAHQRDLDDSESEGEETRDLWEEKHYAGMEIRGAGKVEKLLPDWAAVKCDDDERMLIPPFWVVEVEELPRGSEVEWHAQLGVAGGPVKVSGCERIEGRG